MTETPQPDLFWETLQAKPQGTYNRRMTPRIPDTGWTAPKVFPRLADARVLGLDTETKDPALIEKGPGFRRHDDTAAHIVGISVGTVDGGRWYFPMRHEVAPEQNMNPQHVLAWARDNLCTPGQAKIGANLSYDVDGLWSAGVPVTGPFIDVQHAEALIDSNRFTYNLDSLAQSYLGETKVKTDLAKWIELAYNDDNYRAYIYAAPPCLVGPYAEGDVDLPLRIWAKQRLIIEQQMMMGLFDLETELIPMMVQMRQAGVRVDIEYAKRLDDELTAGILEADTRLTIISGGVLHNLDPDKDISKTDLAKLFDAAGVIYPKTANGAPSFVKEWLERVDHPAGELVRHRRQLQKYRNTFIRSYILDKHVNGRIYALFHQLKGDDNGAVTGRFSSSLPNLQNIPSRDEYWGPKLRALFIPEEGELWVRHDWSQIEYRFLAHYARGPSGEAVRERYRNDPSTDFHEMTLDLVAPFAHWDISTSAGRKRWRKPVKNINFGLVYGMGIDTLIQYLGLSRTESEEIIYQYHNAVPFVRQTYNSAKNRAAEKGFIRTAFGRRVRFDLFEPKWSSVTMKAKRYDDAVEEWGSNVRRAYTHKALNGLLQGSAADLMKVAMREIHRSGATKIIGVPKLTCHDELGHSANNSKQHREAISEVKYIMENCMKLDVPIIAEQSRGLNWGAT
jgi:DNA polymerase I-like protein with 3'-5' exonuclease and polymerase domains